MSDLSAAAALLAMMEIPPELCGVGGCAFTPHGPFGLHTWEQPRG